MLFERRDAVRISRPFGNNLAAWGQKRRRRRARWATICSQPARGRSLFVATVLHPRDPLLLSFWYWPNRNDAPRAWQRSCREQPRCRVGLRSVRSRLPWQRLWLELLRSFLIELLSPASSLPLPDLLFAALDAPQFSLQASSSHPEILLPSIGQSHRHSRPLEIA